MEILNDEKSSSSENEHLREHRKHRSIKKLPINLFRKMLREKRNRNERKRCKKKKRRKTDRVLNEIHMLIQSTEAELHTILEDEGDLLADVTVDDTPIELLGKIAADDNQATTIYVKRDGLSTLTVLLPQKQPTIANLKRAVESAARVQLKRECRQKQILSMQQEADPEQENDDVEANATIVGEAPHERRNINESTKSKINRSKCDEEERRQQQHKAQIASTTSQKPIRNTGELVYSTARNGHHHRPNVSWRYLWRAFVLFNIDTNLPLNDEDGRKLLSDFGIKNATNLKFCKREKYYGRKRQ